MGKHKGYNDDLRTSAVNALINYDLKLWNDKSRKLLINLENPNSLCMDRDKSTQGNIRRPTSGRIRKTNERDDRHLCQISKGDVRFTAPQITSKYK